MNRRLFFKRSCAGALLLSCPGLLARENEKRLRFGLVTDIHFAHRHVHGTRYYEQSITKLSEAIDVFNRRKLDFMIELGDLKDMGDIPERGQTLSFLDEIEAKFQTFDGPVYHVLGKRFRPIEITGIIIGTILVAITVEHDKLNLIPYEGIIRFSFRIPVIGRMREEFRF